MKKFVKVAAETEGRERSGRIYWTETEATEELKKLMSIRDIYTRITVTEADLDLIAYLRSPQKGTAGYRIRSNFTDVRLDHRDMMRKVAELLQLEQTSFMTLEVKEKGRYRMLYTYRVEWEKKQC